MKLCWLINLHYIFWKNISKNLFAKIFATLVQVEERANFGSGALNLGTHKIPNNNTIAVVTQARYRMASAINRSYSLELISDWTVSNGIYNPNRNLSVWSRQGEIFIIVMKEYF